MNAPISTNLTMTAEQADAIEKAKALIPAGEGVVGLRLGCLETPVVLHEWVCLGRYVRTANILAGMLNHGPDAVWWVVNVSALPPKDGIVERIKSCAAMLNLDVERVIV